MSANTTNQFQADTIHELRQRLDELMDDDSLGTGERAKALAEIEAQLVTLVRDSDDKTKKQETDIFRQAAEVRRWRYLCQQMGVTDGVEKGDKLLDRLLDRAGERWEESVRNEDSAADAKRCFDRMLRTSRHQLAAAEHHHWPRKHVQRLAPLKEDLRRQLEEAVASATLSVETRNAWTKSLVDQADVVLAQVDEFQPGPAAEQLAVVRDDLQWHLNHIETERGARRKRLSRKLRRIRAESQERELQDQLESRFGSRFVAFGERLILFLICLVLGLMLLEWLYPGWSRSTIVTFHLIDSAACFIFLAEFGTKLACVSEKGFWFRRHFLIDFIPSIPIGLLTLGLQAGSPADSVRWGRVGRFLRLPRLVRYIRLLRPLLRLARGFGLLARGLDRLAPRYAALLNRNIILYPTREELNRLREAGGSLTWDITRLRIQIRHWWWQTLREAEEDERATVVAQRLAILEKGIESAQLTTRFVSTESAGMGREMPARPLLQKLANAEASDIEATLDEELLQQFAGIVRTFSRAPLRWLPIISSFVPHVGDEMSDAELVAATARKSATTLKRYHDAWFWVADLYGTVTPSQFVDRVGTMLVNSSFRPAYRLALFGGAFLLVQLGLMLTAMEFLQPLEDFLKRYVGVTILVLGSVSIVVLALGLWMKRLGREATEFYERSAEAKYLSLTEVIRTRDLDRDAGILYERVFGVNRDKSDSTDVTHQNIEVFKQRIRKALGSADWSDRSEPISESIERLVLLCRDWLDGAMFTHSDTRITSQLLGSPAINQLLAQSRRVDAKQQQALSKLDLRRQQSMFGGPYLWFNFISRACVHAVAVALVEYNRNAIPLAALDRYSEEQRRRYEQWLNREGEFDEKSEKKARKDEKMYVSTAFTVLHFLDCDPDRDRQVRERFGEKVLRRMQEDRQLIIRRIFGTYPMDKRPKEDRVVNLYSFYQAWLAGGRALFLPAFLMLVAMRGIRWLVQWIAISVREIRQPAMRSNRLDAAQGDFRTAVRKINRVRLPVVLASLRLRVQVDPEYLGLSLPGEEPMKARPQLEEDRAFLDLDVDVSREIERHLRRGRAEMRRFRRLMNDRLLERAATAVGLSSDAFNEAQHRRAAAIAYFADYRGVRSRLSAHTVLKEVFRSVAEEPPRSGKLMPRPFMKRTFRRYWQRYGFGGKMERNTAWRAVRHNVWGVADALNRWSELGQEVEEDGLRVMGELLQDAEQICEELMTLRAVQSLAVLDVLHYREHVFRLGNYGRDETPPREWLEWHTETSEPK